MGRSLSVASLFSGVGGIERGLASAGHAPALFCESWEPARLVLADRYRGVPLVGDVATLPDTGPVDLVTAGFPCQDLSQAGRTRGIGGARSGLVSHVFRLMDTRAPSLLMLENVTFMLALDRGAAMRYLVDELESRGYGWAYRTVDSRAFGVPQRRRRVVLIAARDEDPARVIFADAGAEPPEPAEAPAYGFYWTEGRTGIGWAVDAVPTIRGGSSIGIASPPAVWVPASGEIGTIAIGEAERLQGLEAGHTAAALALPRGAGLRWKLVGNAVTASMAGWVGRRLAEPGAVACEEAELDIDAPWPPAARGGAGRRWAMRASEWPTGAARPSLAVFLAEPLAPLSARATRGFLDRAGRGSLRFRDGFLEAVRAHGERMSDASRP